jgi:hypothetical protein
MRVNSTVWEDVKEYFWPSERVWGDRPMDQLAAPPKRVKRTVSELELENRRLWIACFILGLLAYCFSA